MIIHVQRESGLANRTIVLSTQEVRLLRFLGSRMGLLLGGAFAATWLLFAVLTTRVPALTARVAELERENVRLDTLQAALSKLHGRYEQVRRMLSEATHTTPSAEPTREVTAPGSHPRERAVATPQQ
jgi:hypothetical protein